MRIRVGAAPDAPVRRAFAYLARPRMADDRRDSASVASRRHREVPSGGFSPGDGVIPGTIPEPADPDASDPADLAVQRSEYDERVRDLAQLKPRERRDLALFAAGYSYREIAEQTDSTYTAVNRRVNEARATLARLAAQRGGEPPTRER